MFGDTITVERKISANGTSGYALKDAVGRWASGLTAGSCAIRAFCVATSAGGGQVFGCRSAPMRVLLLFIACRVHGRKRDDLEMLLQTLGINAANPVRTGVQLLL